MSGKMVAAVFPGQGSQRAGMGADFHAWEAASRIAYQEASDALGWDVSSLCFGNDERLRRTAFAQPCIVTTEIAMLRGLKARYGFAPTLFGGHSLGEFTALVAAGAIPFGEALTVVQERGRLMQEAVPAGKGGMTAVIADAVDPDTVARHLHGLEVDIANINSHRQLVLSGTMEAVTAAERILQKELSSLSSLRFVRLNVDIPFHSRLMAPLVNPFRRVLEDLGNGIDPAAAACVTSNFRGGFHAGGREDIIENLAQQLCGAVRWTDNMRSLASRAHTVREIGPGRPLREFFGTIGVSCLAVTTVAAAERIFGPFASAA